LSAKEENDIRLKKRKREREREKEGSKHTCGYYLCLRNLTLISNANRFIVKDHHSSIRNAPSSQVQPKCGHFRFTRKISDCVGIETLKRLKFHHNNLDLITNLLSPISSKQILFSHWSNDNEGMCIKPTAISPLSLCVLVASILSLQR